MAQRVHRRAWVERLAGALATAGLAAAAGLTGGAATAGAQAAPPALSINDIRVIEGNSGVTNAVFTVTRGGSTQQAVSASFITESGSAKGVNPVCGFVGACPADSDFFLTGGTVRIPAGQTQATITVRVLGDQRFEPDERFSVVLSRPTGAIGVSIARQRGEAVIADDRDPRPNLSIESVTVTEGSTAPLPARHNAVVRVTLSNPTDETVRVNFTTADGTAVAGDCGSAGACNGDYVRSSGVLTFEPGRTQQLVLVPVLADRLREPDERFTVLLSGPLGAGIANGAGTVTITNDD